MYAALSPKRLAGLMLWPFGAAIVALVIAMGVPSDARGWFRLLGAAMTVWTVVMTAVFGFSGRWAPWRCVWWLFPFLNKWLFPDLNGTWRGTTSSNWSRIERMLGAAEGAGGLVRAGLSSIPLQEDEVTMTIRASLFSLRIGARLHRTGGRSHSITERVTREKRRDVHELYYVYEQETPDAAATDEERHVGAAALVVDTDSWTLEGDYWTKRMWRSGLNTAGRIMVARIAR